MSKLLRLLLTLFTILCSTTICSASIQESQAGVVFEKACVYEGGISFWDDFNAPKTVTKLDYVPTSGAPLVGQSGKTTTILGSYQDDMRHILSEMGNIKSLDFGAKPGGFNILNVPDELYNPAQFWSQYNRPWLNQALLRGDNIIFATKPKIIPGALIRINGSGKLELSGFGQEYLLLRRNGFPSQLGK